MKKELIIVIIIVIAIIILDTITHNYTKINFAKINEQLEQIKEISEDIYIMEKEQDIAENTSKEGKENVIFSQKAKTLVKEIADFSRNTRIYRKAEARREEFRNETKDATPALIYGYLLDRVVNAPTMLHASSSVILLIPRLDELLNGTEEA